MASKTLDIDAVTNSALMGMSKELARCGLDIYQVDRTKQMRNTIRTLLATFVADHNAQVVAGTEYDARLGRKARYRRTGT